MAKRKYSGSVKEPDRIISYFKREKKTLLLVTIAGIFYNIGMTAGPWFEGQLAQYLCDIIYGKKKAHDMLALAITYILVILSVQFMRFIKRLYVRKFANHMNRDMKEVLYQSLVQKKTQEYETQSIGAIMTKAISDVDVCVEGMRKFTTEIFDTGVVMAAYLVMLLSYDWRLTLLSLLFPPIAYVIAEKLKKTVSCFAVAYKESAGRLNQMTLDRVLNALTYRVYGQEKNQSSLYENSLLDYEQKAVRTNMIETAMQPVYQIISMIGAIFILWFGAKNVLGEGWTNWNIAAFTTFLSCFTKLAIKSSKAAKLFNAVQKARVSWERIKPLLHEVAKEQEKIQNPKGQETQREASLILTGVSFHYPGKENMVLKGISFCAKKGEIIGVTGPVACGKSTLGKVLLGEMPYEGSIRFSDRELFELAEEGCVPVSYMGHEPELLSSSIKENICLKEPEEVEEYLRVVCMEEEVAEMPMKSDTLIGNGGVRLSGGQQARIALARALWHEKPVYVLDDPFSAVDYKTECEMMERIRPYIEDKIVLLFSHRLTLFPQMNQVIWMEDGRATVATHEKLMEEKEQYRRLYLMQEKGEMQHEK